MTCDCPRCTRDNKTYEVLRLAGLILLPGALVWWAVKEAYEWLRGN